MNANAVTIEPGPAANFGGRPKPGQRQGDRACATPGCGEPAQTRGVCYRCYGFWWRRKRKGLVPAVAATVIRQRGVRGPYEKGLLGPVSRRFPGQKRGAFKRERLFEVRLLDPNSGAPALRRVRAVQQRAAVDAAMADLPGWRVVAAAEVPRAGRA